MPAPRVAQHVPMHRASTAAPSRCEGSPGASPALKRPAGGQHAGGPLPSSLARLAACVVSLVQRHDPCVHQPMRDIARSMLCTMGRTMPRRCKQKTLLALEIASSMRQYFISRPEVLGQHGVLADLRLLRRTVRCEELHVWRRPRHLHR